MQKFILFKDGKPYKGFHLELDLMNAYSQEFDRILNMVEKRDDGKGFEFAVYRFFKKIQPAKYIKKLQGYESCMKEYVVGNPELQEAGVVCGFDWDDLGTENKKQFYKYSKRFAKKLEQLNAVKGEDVFKPELGVVKGSRNLEEL